MANWRLIFFQGQGDARRCYTEAGTDMCLIIAQRVGNDPELNDARRVVGMGIEREDARISLDAGIRRYDPTWSGVFVS